MSQPSHDDDLLTAAESARQLGMARGTLYQWLGESDVGTLRIRGQPVTIAYYQTGAAGKGAIRIEAREIRRLKELLRVQPQLPTPRRRPMRKFPGITVPLGRPD